MTSFPLCLLLLISLSTTVAFQINSPKTSPPRTVGISPISRSVDGSRGWGLTQRSSPTSLNGLFGLGGPEIAICLVAAGVVLGPQKLGELTKELGKGKRASEPGCGAHECRMPCVKVITEGKEKSAAGNAQTLRASR